MTNEEAIRELKAMYEHILPHMSIMGTEAYDMAIKALEKEPCDDAISRQAAIEHYRVTDPEGTFAYCNSIIKFLENLPPVTPQPKAGEWLKNGELCKCSNCHSNVLFSAVKFYNYCPNCGAKMEVEE